MKRALFLFVLLTACAVLHAQTPTQQRGDDSIQSYFKKGDEAMSGGLYAIAVNYYKKAEPFVQQRAKTSEFRALYDNLLVACFKAKQYDEALTYAERAKAIVQSIYSEKDERYYMYYNDIASICKASNDTVRCLQAMDSALLVLSLPGAHDNASDLYLRRGVARSHFKLHELALADYQHVDSIRQQSGKDYDKTTIFLLTLMGGKHFALKHYDEAERLYTRYAEVCRRVYPDDARPAIDATIYLASAEAYAGRIEKGCATYAAALDSLKSNIRHRLATLTTSNREAYWSETTSALLDITPFAVEAGETQSYFTRVGYNALVLNESFLLETEHAVRDLVMKHGSTHDQQTYRQIEQLQQRITNWERRPNQYADSLIVGYRQLEAMEGDLMNNCRRLGEITQFMTIGYDEIKACLGKNDVLLDFTDYSPRSRGRVYAAYVVKRDQQFPLLRELFAESSLDSLHVTRPQQYYDAAAAEQLLQCLWTPLSGEVKEGATVYYVPSQLLYQVAIESLPLSDGTLLGDHYHFVRLSSSRELVRYAERLNLDDSSAKTQSSAKAQSRNKVQNHKPSATLYGGLLYDVDPTTMALEASKSSVSPLFVQRGMDAVRGDSVYHELPASLLEVEAIARTLTSNGFDVNLLTRTAGTEESFLALSDHAPQLLHLATHGFYYTPSAAAKVNYLRGYNDAMSLSGLVLSGGNAGWRGRELPDGVLGGVLTASNIARLNLEGTQLAVLSACQTAQGRVTPEGLYGLHRAFKKAGVRSLVMTLWSVSDAATSLFMTTFYDALATNAWDKHRAFRLAQSAVRTAYPDPYYWAAFVMVD